MTPNITKLPILAIVVPCFNEEETLPTAILKLSGVLAEMIQEGAVAVESYLYFVDDGSSDSTWRLILSGHMEDPRVRGLKLSRNFGHQNALLAGLMSLKRRCDISISIDADLQQDPLAMKDFVRMFMGGAEIVFGVRRDRSSDGGFKKVSAILFYRLMTAMGVNTIPNHADYRLLSRRVMDAVGEHPEPNIFLRAICASLGFKTAIVKFDVVERFSGQSKYSIFRMLKLAIDGITLFSVVPLRLIAVFGVLIFGISALMGVYILIHALAFDDTVPGWASTTLPIYFLGGVQLLCLSIIGEYVSQILVGVKKRPRFIVEDEID